MQVNYAPFFNDLGFKESLYNVETNQFSVSRIKERIEDIIQAWRIKYPNISYNIKKIKFENLVNFNQTFCEEAALLQFN